MKKRFPILGPDDGVLQGTVVSIYEIGCFAGAIATIYCGNKFGRIKCMLIGCIIIIIGAASKLCFSVGHFIVARIVTGVGTGFMTSTVPVWQSELSRATTRGKLIMLMGSLITAGVATLIGSIWLLLCQ